MKYRNTSREAWEAHQAHKGELDRQIMAALGGSGKNGMICEDVERVLRRSHQAVSGNLRHLVEDGLVSSTKLRGKTVSGRSAIVWVLRENYDPEAHGPKD